MKYGNDANAIRKTFRIDLVSGVKRSTIERNGCRVLCMQRHNIINLLEGVYSLELGAWGFRALAVMYHLGWLAKNTPPPNRLHRPDTTDRNWK